MGRGRASGRIGARGSFMNKTRFNSFRNHKNSYHTDFIQQKEKNEKQRQLRRQKYLDQ